MYNQDNLQRKNAIISMFFELFRVIMGTCLLCFVPQLCGDHACGILDNINMDNFIFIVCNGFTCIVFLGLYVIEFMRENKLINLLEISPTKPTDIKSIEKALKKIDNKQIQTIWKIDKLYMNYGYAAIVTFLFNCLASGYSIYWRYLDQTTITVYITNIVFMGSKLYNVMYIVNTNKNEFYSAYSIQRLQYNDVDPDKIKKIKKITNNIIENIDDEKILPIII